MDKIVLFRTYDTDSELELSIAKKYFNTTQQRNNITNKLVIPRYSALPFYKELELDLASNHSKLINSYKEHLFISDLMNYYPHVSQYTPRTYTRLEDLPEQGPFILKGQTNSMKHLWGSHMFANNKQEAILVYLRLQEDSLISQQNIYIRDFLPFNQLTIGINGQPIINEWRVFCYKSNILSYGFYWTNFLEYKPYKYLPKEALELVTKLITIVSNHTNFYVLDIAEYNNEWKLIEINDGSMSGLSDSNPEELYSNLLKNV